MITQRIPLAEARALRAIAMMNLVLDFDMVERMEEGGFPKFMEWYGAFSLMVTIVWLYMEILRLLARSRR